MNIIKRILSVVIVALLSFSFVGCNGNETSSSSSSDNFPLTNKDYQNLTYSEKDYMDKISVPFWKGNIAYNETTLPINYENGNVYATLLFKPLKIVKVMDQKLKISYEEGKDYTLDSENKKLIIPEGSAIKTLHHSVIDGKTKEELTKNIEDDYTLVSGLPSGNQYMVDWGFVYTESSLFYGKYLSVTYAYETDGVDQSIYAKYDKFSLAKVRSKLENHNDITIAVIGDSITEGCSSTGDSLFVEPNQPSYPKLLKAELERIYGVNITLVNAAKGGTKSDWPLTGEGAQKFNMAKLAKPDLCIIAYGMNDIAVTDKITYQFNIEGIMSEIKTASPDVEFILVNSFPCNPIYKAATNAPEDIFEKYLSALEKIEEDNEDGSVKVVDMQKVGIAYMKEKQFCEISSSNCNHPNDFFHRVYAMNIASTIFDYKTESRK